MSDGTAPATARAATEAPDGREGDIDWSRIEASEEFRELTRRRHGFIAGAAAVTFGAFALYLALAVFATDFMGTLVGGVPIGWLAAMTQVLVTWAVTWTYLRKADTEFAPLEQRVIDRAEVRFTRDGDEAPAAPARVAATERSVR